MPKQRERECACGRKYLTDKDERQCPRCQAIDRGPCPTCGQQDCTRHETAF